MYINIYKYKIFEIIITSLFINKYILTLIIKHSGISIML